MQIPFESDDDGSGEASGSDEERNQLFREAPDDIIFDESADEASEDTDPLMAEGSSDALVTENSVSEDNISMENTAATASEDNVSMEDVAAITEEGDLAEKTDSDREETSMTGGQIEASRMESGASKSEELPARTSEDVHL